MGRLNRTGGRAHRRRTVLLGVSAVVLAMLKFAAVASAAGMIWIHLCGSWTPGSGGTGGVLGVAYSGASNAGVSTPYQCPGPGSFANGMEVFGGGSNVPAGGRAYWQINAPSGLAIVGVHTEGSGMISYGVDSGMGWGGGFYWQGGGAQTYPGQIGYSSPPLFSSYFGWQIICGWSTCNGVNKPGEISVLGLELEAAEGSGPSVFVTPGSLGAPAGGSVGRGQSDSPLMGRPAPARGKSGWRERVPAAQRTAESGDLAPVPCGVVLPVVQYGCGCVGCGSPAGDVGPRCRLRLQRRSLPIGYSDELRQRRQRSVSVSVAGPTDAPSTAGTQYVTATGKAVLPVSPGSAARPTAPRLSGIRAQAPRYRWAGSAPPGHLLTALTTPETLSGTSPHRRRDLVAQHPRADGERHCDSESSSTRCSASG